MGADVDGPRVGGLTRRAARKSKIKKQNQKHNQGEIDHTDHADHADQHYPAGKNIPMRCRRDDNGMSSDQIRVIRVIRSIALLVLQLLLLLSMLSLLSRQRQQSARQSRRARRTPHSTADAPVARHVPWVLATSARTGRDAVRRLLAVFPPHRAL